ncbi:MAG: hypothetical protein Q9210_003909, partial [Variospora velana]
PAFIRLLQAHADGVPLPAPPPHPLRHIRVQERVVHAQRLGAHDLPVGRVAVLGFEDAADAGGAEGESEAEFGVVGEEEGEVVCFRGGGRGRNGIGGEHAADLGDEGVGEGFVGSEVVAGKEDAGVDFAGGHGGEEAVVEHKLHERGAEGGGFGDGARGAGFHVGDVDVWRWRGGLRVWLARGAEVGLGEGLRVVWREEVCNAFLVGWESRWGVCAVALCGFELRIGAGIGQLVDDAVDDQPVENAPHFELTRHACFPQCAETLDDVPYPQSPGVFLGCYSDCYSPVDLLLERFVDSAALFHCWRAPFPAMLREGEPILEFTPRWRNEVRDGQGFLRFGAETFEWRAEIRHLELYGARWNVDGHFDRHRSFLTATSCTAFGALY